MQSFATCPPSITVITPKHRELSGKQHTMSDGLDCGARAGAIYHSPVAACQVTHLEQSYGFHLAANNTNWMHHGGRASSIEQCLTIDLRDLFHGTTKCAEIESDVTEGGTLVQRYFVPIHPGCKSGTKLIFPCDDRDYSAAAIFTVYDEIDDDECVNMFRYGSDVYMRFAINVRMALCGFTLQVNAIDGRVLKLSISDIVSPDYVRIIPNEGLPKREHPSERGDLHLCFKIEFPKTLSRHSKADIADALDRAQP